MKERKEEILAEVTAILRNSLDPLRIFLFGSRAKGENDEHADFDFAVDSEKPALSVQRQISEEVEKIAGLYKIDIVYMPSVDKDFREIIIKTGKVIYEKRT